MSEARRSIIRIIMRSEVGVTGMGTRYLRPCRRSMEQCPYREDIGAKDVSQYTQLNDRGWMSRGQGYCHNLKSRNLLLDLQT